MKAIILAAGEGSRLRPLTEDRPKCLVEVDGKSILDRQIETMRACGIDDVIVVKGYKQEKITRGDVRYYINSDYDTTNMVMTLWCAEAELDGEVVISYGDILYNETVLKALLSDTNDISVIVDMSWHRYWTMRFDDPLSDAEALSMDNDGRIKIIGQKAREISDVEAGYIGLIKFKSRGISAFRESFLNARRVSSRGGKPWGITKPFEKAFMTDMLQGLINEGHRIQGVKIDGGWLEIDSLRDYKLAGDLFVNGEVIPVNQVLRR